MIFPHAPAAQSFQAVPAVQSYVVTFIGCDLKITHSDDCSRLYKMQISLSYALSAKGIIGSLSAVDSGITADYLPDAADMIVMAVRDKYMAAIGIGVRRYLYSAVGKGYERIDQELRILRHDPNRGCAVPCDLYSVFIHAPSAPSLCVHFIVSHNTAMFNTRTGNAPLPSHLNTHSLFVPYI